jgi:hypothetical protein
MSLVPDARRERASKNPLIVIFMQLLANRNTLPSRLQRIRKCGIVGVRGEWSHARNKSSETNIFHRSFHSPDIVTAKNTFRTMSVPSPEFGARAPHRLTTLPDSVFSLDELQ